MIRTTFTAIVIFLLTLGCGNIQFGSKRQKKAKEQGSLVGQPIFFEVTAPKTSKIGFGGQKNFLTQEVKQLGAIEVKPEKITQGTGATQVSAIYQPGGAKSVDIALVLDTSQSMNDQVQAVASQLSNLTKSLTDNKVSWQIKLVPSNILTNITLRNRQDPSQKKLVRYFAPCAFYSNEEDYFLFSDTDPNVFERFADTLTQIAAKVPSTGYFLENMIFSASQALVCEALFPSVHKASWLRPQSNIDIIFVSDSNNCETETRADVPGQCLVTVNMGNYFPASLPSGIKNTLWNSMQNAVTASTSPLAEILNNVTDINNTTNPNNQWTIDKDSPMYNLAKMQYARTLMQLLTSQLPIGKPSLPRDLINREDCSQRQSFSAEVFGLFKFKKDQFHNWAYRPLLGSCDTWDINSTKDGELNYDEIFPVISELILPFSPKNVILANFKMTSANNPALLGKNIPETLQTPNDMTLMAQVEGTDAIAYKCDSPNLQAFGCNIITNPTTKKSTVSFHNLPFGKDISVSYHVGGTGTFHSAIFLDPKKPIDLNTLTMINTPAPSEPWEVGKNISYIYDPEKGINQLSFNKGKTLAEGSTFEIHYKTAPRRSLPLQLPVTYEPDKTTIIFNGKEKNDGFKLAKDGKSITFDYPISRDDKVLVKFVNPEDEHTSVSYTAQMPYSDIRVIVDDNSCSVKDLKVSTKDGIVKASCSSNPTFTGTIVITGIASDQQIKLTKEQVTLLKSNDFVCSINSEPIEFGTDLILEDEILTVKASLIKSLLDDTQIICRN